MNQPAQDASFGLSDQAFQNIADIAILDAGLSIPISKRALVQSRVSRRMRALGLNAVDDYLSKLTNRKDPEERKELISILTTNVSSFRREQHHFEHFVTSVMPALKKKIEAGGRIRIWSAGCSSGQEPYTIAIEVLKYFTAIAGKDVLVLATDIDPAILRKARGGTYDASDLKVIPASDRNQYFQRDGQTFRVTNDLRNLIRFRELNLHSEWPMTGPFDAIFCRNVLIYFDDAHQRALWPRFRNMLTDGGHLYLGHSERIHPLVGSGFESRGATIYQETHETQERQSQNVT